MALRATQQELRHVTHTHTHTRAGQLGCWLDRRQSPVQSGSPKQVAGSGLQRGRRHSLVVRAGNRWGRVSGKAAAG